jgi:hypothetical protein
MLTPPDNKTRAAPGPQRVCDDAGRALFYEHVGVYFSTPSKLKPLPSGTACSVCGSTIMPLGQTSTGQAVCQAQQTITRKRAGRDSADVPCQPAANPAGMKAFADRNMVVAGPQVARVVTKLLPNVLLPAQVEVQFPGSRVLERLLADTLAHPPEPPFVVIVFGQAAGFRSAVTTDMSRIHINGPDGFTVDTRQVLDLMALFAGMKLPKVLALLDLRDRLATGEPRPEDLAALLDLRAEAPALAATLRRLPSPGSAAAIALRRLMAT